MTIAIVSEPKPPTDAVADDAAYYRRVLHGLIELGSELAGLVVAEARAQAAADPTTGEDAGVAGSDLAAATEAFERVSRAVRRTIRMAQFVAEARPGRTAAQQRVTNRRRVLRSVEDMIQRDVAGEAAESLRVELLERLEGPDLDDELLDRPIEEVIRMIRCDLGLPALMGSRDWTRRTPGDVARLERRAVTAAGEGRDLPVRERGVGREILRGMAAACGP